MKLKYSKDINKIVSELLNVPQYQQRTQEWFDARQTCISASDVSSALMQSNKSCDYYINSFKDMPNFKFKIKEKLCCNPYSSTRELIEKKCNLGKPFTGNVYTLHGQKYEQVVSNIYSQLNQVDVLEFGLLVHPEYKFIGASPDGITTEGVMIEIKCPSSRKVQPYPPLNYFQQMLLQLECTKLKECDYIDAHFIEYIDESTWLRDAEEWENENQDKKHHMYGVLITQECKEGCNCEEFVQNIYADASIYKIEDFLEWKDTKFSECNDCFRVVYYKLNEYYICRVKASNDWILSNLQEIKQVWDKIEYHRTENGKLELEQDIRKKQEGKKKYTRKNEGANKIKYTTSLFT